MESTIENTRIITEFMGYESQRVINTGELSDMIYKSDIRSINHYYVWQTGYDDSYNGFLLCPLKNGKYLLVEYSC